MPEPRTRTKYQYDSTDRIQFIYKHAGTLQYAWDLAGNLTTLYGALGVTYYYDALNRLAAVHENNTGTTSYTYDNVGNLASVTYPNGVVHSYSYDTRNRLTNLGVNNSSGPIASYAYTLDAAGHRTAVTELSGRTVNYSYDNLYRLTSETIANGSGGQNGVISYVYDPVGNRTQMNSTVPAIPAGNFFYDANDRFTTGDTYDANGNTISSGGVPNAYDFENHLIQKDAGVTIVYDGDGNRVSKTVAGVTTLYLVDSLNPTGYAQVVAEAASNGAAQEGYYYGLEQIGRVKVFGTAPTVFYVHDGHGSVRALTNTTGAVTDTYDYDAFGNLIHSTGTTPNNYLFAGEQYDPDLRLYYNRARYLNTNTGRFWTMDTDEDSQREPLSLHKYLYASDDGVNRTDPSGNQDFVSELGAESVVATLNSLSVFLPQGGAAGGPAWQLLAHAIIPGWVWNSLASSLTPDAVEVGFSFTGTRSFGPVSITGGPGLEALFSGKTGNWAAYLSAGLVANFGGSSVGTTLAGSAGLVYNLPRSSNYAGPFVNFSVPASLLPNYIVAKISAGLFAAYGALAANTNSRGAAIAFLAAADGIYLGLLAAPENLTLNVFWGYTDVWGVTVSVGPANNTPHRQFGVTADILLTSDVPFE